MRIVTGEFKGRNIETPPDKHVRPTSGKVKEGMFSILAERTDGAVCVDLFAGTGSLGLEALSRGALRCYFGDNAKDSIEMVKRNVELCGAGEWSVICPGDYMRVLHRIHEPVDIFFLDPPYKKGLYESCFEEIGRLELLADDGVIVAEHSADDDFPEEMAGFARLKERKYGTVMVSIYGFC